MKKTLHVTAPKELLVDTPNVAEQIAQNIIVLEQQTIERATLTMLKKLNIQSIPEAQQLGYDILVQNNPDGSRKVQLFKLVDYVTIKVNVCTR